MLFHNYFKWIEKEMIHDCLRNNEEVIVVELNSKLFYSHDKIAKRLFNEFPELLTSIKKRIISNELKLLPGNVLIEKCRGYTICIIINQDKFSDEERTTGNFTKWGLKQMVSTLGTDKKYISGYMENGYQALKSFVKETNLSWYIYYE